MTMIKKELNFLGAKLVAIAPFDPSGDQKKISIYSENDYFDSRHELTAYASLELMTALQETAETILGDISIDDETYPTLFWDITNDQVFVQHQSDMPLTDYSAYLLAKICNKLKEAGAVTIEATYEGSDAQTHSNWVDQFEFTAYDSEGAVVDHGAVLNQHEAQLLVFDLVKRESPEYFNAMSADGELHLDLQTGEISLNYSEINESVGDTFITSATVTAPDADFSFSFNDQHRCFMIYGTSKEVWQGKPLETLINQSLSTMTLKDNETNTSTGVIRIKGDIAEIELTPIKLVESEGSYDMLYSSEATTMFDLLLKGMENPFKDDQAPHTPRLTTPRG